MGQRQRRCFHLRSLRKDMETEAGAEEQASTLMGWMKTMIPGTLFDLKDIGSHANIDTTIAHVARAYKGLRVLMNVDDCFGFSLLS